MSDPGPDRRPRPDPAGTPGSGGSTVARAGAACAVRGIVKRYGAAVALQDVSIEVAAGEIHALVGENGAGSRRWARSSPARWRPMRARSSSTASR